MSAILPPWTEADHPLAGSRTRSAARLRVMRIVSETGRLASAASPIAIIGILQMMLALTDLVMVGRSDPDGLASIVVVSDFYSIVFNFTAGFAGVVAPFVAAAIGARVHWRVCTIVHRILILVCLLALIGTLVIYNAPAALGWFGVVLRDPAATATYGSFMAGTYAFMVLFALGRHALSGMERSRFAVIAIVAAVPLKVLFNHICIEGVFGWEGMGAPGAGLASLFVALFTGGSLTAYLFLSRSFDSFKEPPLVTNILDIREMASLTRSGVLMGVAAVAETGVFLGSTILIGIVAADALTAHTLAFRAMATCYLMIAAFGQAVTIRIAFLGGRGTPAHEAHAMRAVATCTLSLMLALALLFSFAEDAIASLLVRTIGNGDGVLLEATAPLVKLAGLALVSAIPAHVICAVLRGRRRVLPPVAIMITGHWGVGLPAMAWLGSAGFGATGIWAGLLFGSLAASACALIVLWAQNPRGSPFPLAARATAPP